MRGVDINCDLGESFGVYTYGADAEMMPLITSANVACGGHAGDPGTMRSSVGQAIAHGVAIGAHVGLADRWGFGRREIPTTGPELYELTLAQMGALDAFVRVAGAQLRHLKLHGSLYMMANRDPGLAEAACHAVLDYDSSLAVYALPQSALSAAAARAGLDVVREYFADRSYDGTEVHMYRRSAADIGTPDEAAARTVSALGDPAFTNVGGIDSICVHSDTPDAPRYLRAVLKRLDSAGVTIRPPRSAAGRYAQAGH